jgi:hypothetical protein
VKLDALTATDALRGQSVLMRQATELALDRRTTALQLVPPNRLAWVANLS